MTTSTLHTTAYAAAALDGELEKLRRAELGGNNTLFQVAANLYGLVQARALDEQAVTDQLWTEGLALNLSRQEISDTLKSARKRAQPRALLTGSPRHAQRPATRPVEPYAPEPLAMPPAAWQERAQAFLAYTQDYLWDASDETGLDWLAARGIDPLTTFNAGLGYNLQDRYTSRAKWGLASTEEGSDTLLLPAGIVLPYVVDGQVVKLEVRNLDTGKRTVAGSANVLWGVDRLSRFRPAMLVEGVINALTVLQCAGDVVVPVALGATSHARRIPWLAKLAQCPFVLVATDAGKAGEDAAAYWCDALGSRARRWRPYTDDPNTMHTNGMDVAAWVQAGLEVGQ